MNRLATLWLLLRLSFRNVVAHRGKSIVMILVLLAQTILLVVGLTLTTSMDQALEQNVTSTLAGHLELYSSMTDKNLDLFGLSGGFPDVGTIKDYATVQATTLNVENVQAVIPMIRGAVQISLGNSLEQKMEILRQAIKQPKAANTIQPLLEEIHLRIQQLGVFLDAEVNNPNATPLSSENKALLAQALSEKFWRDLNKNLDTRLEFLDLKIAPLLGAGPKVGFPFFGTDPEQFSTNFKRFEIVQGTMIPKGVKGCILADKTYNQFKHPWAQAWDIFHFVYTQYPQNVNEETWKNWSKELLEKSNTLVRDILPSDMKKLETAFTKILPNVPPHFPEQIRAFCQISANNFLDRREQLNRVLGQYFPLFSVAIGDTLTLESLNSFGQRTSTEVKLFGTYHFRGLETFDMAANFSMVDIVSARELKGYSSIGVRDEMAAIKKNAGIVAIDTQNIESQLFAAPVAVQETIQGTSGLGRPGVLSEFSLAANKQKGPRDVYDPSEIQHGLVEHAAVWLKNPTATPATIEVLSEKLKPQQVQIVRWEQASGLMAQYFDLVRGTLIIGLFIVFLVAMIVVSTAIVVTTLERVREIGTLRAVGAHPRFVLEMVMIDVTIISITASLLGILASYGILQGLQKVGIPAIHQVLRFLFGGPRLYPGIFPTHFWIAAGLTLVIALLATLYPARLATKVQPVEALREGG